MRVSESAIHFKAEEENLLEQARDFVKREDWRRAVAVLNPHRQAGKLSIEGLGLLAYSYSQDKKYDKAISIYEGKRGARSCNHALFFYNLCIRKVDLLT